MQRLSPARLAAYLGLVLFILAACKKDPPPPADAQFTFTVNNDSVAPAQVSFANGSSNASTWEWNFGNGETSTQQNPTVTYTEPGTYRVRLNAIGNGSIDSMVQTVTIRPNLPQASFTLRTLSAASYPVQVEFTNTSQLATTYEWSFGEGQTSTQASPSLSFNESRPITVRLIARNQYGADTVIQRVQPPHLDKSLRVLYILPSDHAYNATYYDAIRTNVPVVQDWFRGQLGAGFRFNNPIVDTVRVEKNTAWFTANHGSSSGVTPEYYYFYNTVSELERMGYTFVGNRNHIYVFMVPVPGQHGWGTAQSSGLRMASLPERYMSGLAGTNPEVPVTVSQGLLAHELGRALGLKQTEAPASGPVSIMVKPPTSISRFPRVTLTPEEKTAALATGFLF